MEEQATYRHQHQHDIHHRLLQLEHQLLGLDIKTGQAQGLGEGHHRPQQQEQEERETIAHQQNRQQQPQLEQIQQPSTMMKELNFNMSVDDFEPSESAKDIDDDGDLDVIFDAVFDDDDKYKDYYVEQLLQRHPRQHSQLVNNMPIDDILLNHRNNDQQHQQRQQQKGQRQDRPPLSHRTRRRQQLPPHNLPSPQQQVSEAMNPKIGTPEKNTFRDRSKDDDDSDAALVVGDQKQISRSLSMTSTATSDHDSFFLASSDCSDSADDGDIEDDNNDGNIVGEEEDREGGDEEVSICLSIPLSTRTSDHSSFASCASESDSDLDSSLSLNDLPILSMMMVPPPQPVEVAGSLNNDKDQQVPQHQQQHQWSIRSCSVLTSSLSSEQLDLVVDKAIQPTSELVEQAIENEHLSRLWASTNNDFSVTGSIMDEYTTTLGTGTNPKRTFTSINNNSSSGSLSLSLSNAFKEQQEKQQQQQLQGSSCSILDEYSLTLSTALNDAEENGGNSKQKKLQYQNSSSFSKTSLMTTSTADETLSSNDNNANNSSSCESLHVKLLSLKSPSKSHSHSRSSTVSRLTIPSPLTDTDDDLVQPYSPTRIRRMLSDDAVVIGFAHLEQGRDDKDGNNENKSLSIIEESKPKPPLSPPQRRKLSKQDNPRGEEEFDHTILSPSLSSTSNRIKAKVPRYSSPRATRHKKQHKAKTHGKATTTTASNSSSPRRHRRSGTKQIEANETVNNDKNHTFINAADDDGRATTTNRIVNPISAVHGRSWPKLDDTDTAAAAVDAHDETSNSTDVDNLIQISPRKPQSWTERGIKNNNTVITAPNITIDNEKRPTASRSKPQTRRRKSKTLATDSLRLMQRRASDSALNNWQHLKEEDVHIGKNTTNVALNGAEDEDNCTYEESLNDSGLFGSKSFSVSFKPIKRISSMSSTSSGEWERLYNYVVDSGTESAHSSIRSLNDSSYINNSTSAMSKSTYYNDNQSFVRVSSTTMGRLEDSLQRLFGGGGEKSLLNRSRSSPNLQSQLVSTMATQQRASDILSTGQTSQKQCSTSHDSVRSMERRSMSSPNLMMPNSMFNENDDWNRTQREGDDNDDEDETAITANRTMTELLHLSAPTSSRPTRNNAKIASSARKERRMRRSNKRSSKRELRLSGTSTLDMDVRGNTMHPRRKNKRHNDSASYSAVSAKGNVTKSKNNSNRKTRRHGTRRRSSLGTTSIGDNVDTLKSKARISVPSTDRMLNTTTRSRRRRSLGAITDVNKHNSSRMKSSSSRKLTSTTKSDCIEKSVGYDKARRPSKNNKSDDLHHQPPKQRRAMSSPNLSRKPALGDTAISPATNASWLKQQ